MITYVRNGHVEQHAGFARTRALLLHWVAQGEAITILEMT